MFLPRWVLIPASLLPGLCFAHHDAGHDRDGLSDSTVLIVRHDEKTAGDGLSPLGQLHAQAYASYFDPFRLDGQALVPQRLLASSDSHASIRPRLTLTPLSRRLGVPVEQPYADAQVDQLVGSLRKDNRAPVVLIAWHHGEIPALLKSFGAKPKRLLGAKKWPQDVYDWVVVLRFDHAGMLRQDASQRVIEHGLPGGED